MDELTDKYLEIAASRDHFAPDALTSDPLDQKLLTCWQSLASTAASNQLNTAGCLLKPSFRNSREIRPGTLSMTVVGFLYPVTTNMLFTDQSPSATPAILGECDC
jgi:hypothetical protein